MSEHYRTIAILAGGQSRRMGSDKAELLLQGESLLQHVAQRALCVADRVLVAGRQRPLGWLLDGIEFLPDETPGLGPLGGLKTALQLARRERISSVMLIACDMPQLDKVALRWLFTQAEARDLKHGLVPLRENADGSPVSEPLFAVYNVSCLPLVEEQIAQGQRSLRRLYEKGDFEFIELPAALAPCLANINTPEDWEQFQAQRKAA